MNLHFSGVCLYKRDKIIVFIQTDLPEPVVPAISKCGIEARSPTMGVPDILLPKAIGNLISFFLKSVSFNISLKYTFSLDKFGNSIPIVFLPGMVEIRADSELVFLAISSERFIIFETLIPALVQIHLKLQLVHDLLFLYFHLPQNLKEFFQEI